MLSQRLTLNSVIVDMTSYQRKSNRGSWLPQNMEEAIQKVKSGELTIRDASTAFAVPRATLSRRVLGKNKIAKDAQKHLGRYENVFDKEFEQQLKEYVLSMESRFFGLTCEDLRRLAYQLAEKNGIAGRFNSQKKMAGKKWFYAFRRRNTEITLRAPESTSFARATGFNKPAVGKFYTLLDTLIQKHGLDGSRIYNCDESGMKTVQQQHAKVLAKTGKRQVGSLTSAERGKNVTVICTMSACGVYIPPCFVFPRKRCNPLLMDNAPESSKGFFNESGWMTADVFKGFLNHFIGFVNPSVQKPCLLILDGHASHTKSLEVINLASSSGVILLSLPPHTTHKLQPLDVGFFKPLQTYYDRFIERWLRSHPGRVFTEYQVAEAFKDAYGKAATVEIATNAFRKCGIWPYNPDLFSETDYAPSATTDRPAHDGAVESTTAPLAYSVTLMPADILPMPSTPLESGAAVNTVGEVFILSHIHFIFIKMILFIKCRLTLKMSNI